MRLLFLSFCAAGLAACTPQTQTQPDDGPYPQTLLYEVASYGDEWNVETFWAGEYPKGIGVYKQGVEVLARTVPHPDEPKGTKCTLSYLASYHPWNKTRSDSDALEFITAFKTYDMTATVETEINTTVDDVPKSQRLQPGDIVKFLAYFGEGIGLVEFDGERYDASVSAFDPVVPQNMGASGNLENDEWLGLDCGQERRYVLLSELTDIDGISFGLEGMIAYGRVSDLTEEQAATLRSRNP
jgi:hypothetical protein